MDLSEMIVNRLSSTGTSFSMRLGGRESEINDDCV